MSLRWTDASQLANREYAPVLDNPLRVWWLARQLNRSRHQLPAADRPWFVERVSVDIFQALPASAGAASLFDPLSLELKAASRQLLKQRFGRHHWLIGPPSLQVIETFSGCYRLIQATFDVF